MFIGQDLLDSTQGEHLDSLPFPFLFLSPILSLFPSFPLSVCLALSPCLSSQYHFLFSFSLLFFFNPPPPLPLSLSSRCPVRFIISGFLPCLSFSAVLLFPLSLLSRCPLLFCFILGPLCQSFGLKPRCLLCGWCSSFLCTWLSTRTSSHAPPRDG